MFGELNFLFVLAHYLLITERLEAITWKFTETQTGTNCLNVTQS